MPIGLSNGPASSATGSPTESKIWTESSFVSDTYMLPEESTATPCGDPKPSMLVTGSRAESNIQTVAVAVLATNMWPVPLTATSFGKSSEWVMSSMWSREELNTAMRSLPESAT